MCTHFGYQMPTLESRDKWFFYNGNQGYKISPITPKLVKKIFNAGYSRIYLSLGSKYAEIQENIQKKPAHHDQQYELEGVFFEMIVIDCLNPPHVSICELFPCEYYLMGQEVNVFNKRMYDSWETQKLMLNPSNLDQNHQVRIIFNEIYCGPNCSYTNFCNMGLNCWRRLAGVKQKEYVEDK